MADKKRAATPERTAVPKGAAQRVDDRIRELEEHDDWKEILIVAGTPVREGLMKDERWDGIYLGHVARTSSFGKVLMHLMETEEGVQGMWGHHALDEGFGRCERGIQTRVDGRGMMDLKDGKVMRLVRMRQRGVLVDHAPVIYEGREVAEEVMEALGIHEKEYEIDAATGEVLSTTARAMPDVQ